MFWVFTVKAAEGIMKIFSKDKPVSLSMREYLEGWGHSGGDKRSASKTPGQGEKSIPFYL